LPKKKEERLALADTTGSWFGAPPPSHVCAETARGGVTTEGLPPIRLTACVGLAPPEEPLLYDAIQISLAVVVTLLPGAPIIPFRRSILRCAIPQDAGKPPSACAEGRVGALERPGTSLKDGRPHLNPWVVLAVHFHHRFPSIGTPAQVDKPSPCLRLRALLRR
jgi:hypothetical protein